MIVEDQSAVIDWLARPATHGGAGVERIDTHCAVVFLAGDRAYKLKRAVRFPFLDYGTLEARHTVCAAEVRLNRRTAPALYRGTVAITAEANGSFAFDGSGTPVDWLVAMNRFDQAMLFDRMAACGALRDPVMRDLADAIAAFHDIAEARPDHGGRAGLAMVIDGNMATLRGEARAPFDDTRRDRIEQGWRSALERHGETLEARREAGRVRWCHGDLHLRNICLIDGKPTLFDGIEFSEPLACIDVLYDLAFLLMDLRHRELNRFASLVLNRYLSRTQDVDGLALLPLFQSLRAGVRAMVGAIEGSDDEARAYLSQAESYLEPPPPVLVAVGGLSGTGKSTLAATLAPEIGAAPGALVLRSDVIRKRLLGAEPEQRLGSEAYGAAVNRRVYETLHALARRALGAGHAVILDAVFAQPEERAAVADIARATHVPFRGLWLDAAPEVLRARLEARRDDASDATAAVLERQLGYPIGDLDWHRLDTTGMSQEISARAAQAVREDCALETS
ncbi:MAG: AAA family ATPase [Alphaproteobacteria bacterium]|nr:AAA family ATPase [Alphaproteobacteria bacterium]